MENIQKDKSIDIVDHIHLYEARPARKIKILGTNKYNIYIGKYYYNR